MRKHLSALAVMAVASVAVILPAAAATTVTVSPSNMNGWQETSSPPTTDVTFVNGPATPPLGAGSARMIVGTGATNSAAAQLRNPNFNGTRLADLTQLTYSTYVSNPNNTGQAPYLILNMDNDGNGSIDDQLHFEPVYQNGAYSTVTGATVPDQCAATGCVVLNTWQTWDALEGGWWRLNANTFGPPLTTIDRYLQQNPNAVIRNTGAGQGGIRIVAGFGNPPWGGFVGNVDAFKIGVSGTETVYDFESQSPVACTPVSNSNLLGHWKFDEGSGTTAADSADNHPGTLENGPTWTGGTPQVNPNPSALQFDGTNDQVRVANDEDLRFGSGSFSVSLFAKTASGAGADSVLGNYNGTNRGWGLFFYPNQVNFFAYGTQGINDTNKAATISDNQWHHIAGVFTRSGGTITINTYVDGVSVGTNSAVVGDITSTSDLLFGHYLNQPHYQGKLDDIRVYGRALTAAEVASLNVGCNGINTSSAQSSSSSVSSVSSSASSTSSAGSSSSMSSVSSSGGSSSSASSVGGVPTCNGMAATVYVQNGIIVGGPRNGRTYHGNLRGGDGSDVIVGTNNPDDIRGGDGNDTICGLGGADDIRGGDGDDWIDGGADPDDIRGGDGSDWIDGAGGSDDIRGDDGNDTIRGSGDADEIRGNDGADIMCGMDGPDDLRGDDGADILDGGAGSDDLDGRDGADICRNGETNVRCETVNNNSTPQCQ